MRGASFFTSAPASFSAAHSTAAASADEPPMPPPTGMPFFTVTDRRRPHSFSTSAAAESAVLRSGFTEALRKRTRVRSDGRISASSKTVTEVITLSSVCSLPRLPVMYRERLSLPYALTFMIIL